MDLEKGMYAYEIHVYTGFKKHSETDSNISLVVIGTEGDSGVMKLTDGERKVRVRLLKTYSQYIP